MWLASLPMYDLPEIRALVDDFWRALVRCLKRRDVVDAPERIEHDKPLADLWNNPRMWFSQCCGFDLVNRYAGVLVPLATPHYAAPECVGRDYTSVVVVHEDNPASDVLEMQGAVCAMNGRESHSGMNALRALVAPASRDGRFFSRVIISGTHRGSLRMIQRGAADVAAIDCVTYALLARYCPPAVAGIRKLGETEFAPGIPYVTRRETDAESRRRMVAAIFDVFSDPRLAGLREALLLKDVEAVDARCYRRISEFQKMANQYGYRELH